MTSVVFYLALLFSLGTCAVVNMAPEISEDKINEVIKDLENAVEELKFDEKPTENSNVDFAVENTNTNTNLFYRPRMGCAWHNLIGACCFTFHFTRIRVCVVMVANYPHLHYLIKEGSRHVAVGSLTNQHDDREVDLILSGVKLEFKVKLSYYYRSSLSVCFKADYESHYTKFDGTIGCVRKVFYNGGYDVPPSITNDVNIN